MKVRVCFYPLILVISLFVPNLISCTSDPEHENRAENHSSKKYDENQLTRQLSYFSRLKSADSLFILGNVEMASAYYRALDSLFPEFESLAGKRNLQNASLFRWNETAGNNPSLSDSIWNLYRKEKLRNALIADTLSKLRWTISQSADQEAQKSRDNGSWGRLAFKSAKGKKVIYFGRISNGQANGYGMGLYRESGSIYTGTWRDGRKEGEGIYEWADGEKYEGQYQNDHRQGKGSYYWKNGDSYEGEWDEDKRHGQGTLFDKNGHLIYSGTWKDDKFIRKNASSK